MRIKRRNDGGICADQIREELCEISAQRLKGRAGLLPQLSAHEPGALLAPLPRYPPDDIQRPENHPLESVIAPLVYELKRLEAFHPCWSCWGHNGSDGKLWKIPLVWFYCESVVHLRVLADAVKELYLAEKLSVPWRAVLTFSDDDNANTTFSLEPNLDRECPLLPVLQRDVDTVAEHLRDVVFTKVRKLSRMVR